MCIKQSDTQLLTHPSLIGENTLFVKRCKMLKFKMLHNQGRIYETEQWHSLLWCLFVWLCNGVPWRCGTSSGGLALKQGLNPFNIRQRFLSTWVNISLRRDTKLLAQTLEPTSRRKQLDCMQPPRKQTSSLTVHHFQMRCVLNSQTVNCSHTSLS